MQVCTQEMRPCCEYSPSCIARVCKQQSVRFSSSQLPAFCWTQLSKLEKLEAATCSLLPDIAEVSYEEERFPEFLKHLHLPSSMGIMLAKLEISKHLAHGMAALFMCIMQPSPGVKPGGVG
jgi:hypothetical protein